MKKSVKYNSTVISLIVFMIFLAVPASNAQEMKAGVKGGVNLSWLSVDKANDNNIIPGFNAGVWAKFMANDKFGVQPEILFSSKGMKTIYDNEFLGFDIADGTTKLTLNYIDIPVYLTFNLANDFDFHVGPYIGFLMNANMATDAQILEFIDADSNDDIDRSRFNAIDAGISGGLGFNIDPLTFGFNYGLGLRQVAKDGEATKDLLGDAKNNSFQVFVGFSF